MSIRRYFPDELFRIVKALYENSKHDVTVMDVPDLAGVSKAYAIAILRDLEYGGFISTKAGVKDRRLKYIRLEESGRMLYEHLMAYKSLLDGKMDLYMKSVKGWRTTSWAI